jgi:hypothetical protein
MTNIQYFRSPFLEQEVSERKRQRDDDQDEEEQGENSSHDEDLVDRPIDFPHAPLPSRDANGKPIKKPRVGGKRRNIKRQHVEVLNTILYKCMLDGDYIRAGKAFGMLIRLELVGLKPDLRKNGLWGVGAEILLRRDASATLNDGNTASWFSQAGFQSAKAYYDRLILQYPWRSNHPSMVSGLHFNLAMFGVRIFQIQDRSQSMSAALESGTSVEDITLELEIDPVTDEEHDEPDGYTVIKTWELEQARSILDLMRGMANKPPFDKDNQLLALSGMVSLWVADLAKSLNKAPADIREEYGKASESFGKATKNGASIWPQAEMVAKDGAGMII